MVGGGEEGYDKNLCKTHPHIHIMFSAHLNPEKKIHSLMPQNSTSFQCTA